MWDRLIQIHDQRHRICPSGGKRGSDKTGMDDRYIDPVFGIVEPDTLEKSGHTGFAGGAACRGRKTRGAGATPAQSSHRQHRRGYLNDPFHEGI